MTLPTQQKSFQKYQSTIMKLLLILMTFLFLFVYSKLIYVFGLLRHGSIYPKTALYPVNVREDLQAKLTVVGMRQQYNMGSYLRRDYIGRQGLTSGVFNRSQVEFYASEIERTANSILCVMYGMFPLGTGPNISHSVPKQILEPPYIPLFPNGLQTEVQEISFALKRGFQPIGSKGIDYMLDNCDNYIGLRTIHLESEVKQEVEQLISESAEAMQRIKNVFNLPDSQVNPTNLTQLYKVVDQSKELGLPLPANFTEEDEDALRHIYMTFNALLNQGTFALASISPSLSFMRGKMEAASKGGSTKMTLLSFHQSNVWPWLFVLNLTSPQCIRQQEQKIPITTLNCVKQPYFSTNFLFEIHEDHNKALSVKLKYDGEYVHLCERKDKSCPLDDFLARIAHSTINYIQMCKIPDWMPKPVHISASSMPDSS